MASGDSGGAKCAWTRTASAARLMAISESCREPLVAGDQKAFGQPFSIALPIQAHRGLPCMGPFFRCSACEAHRGTSLTGVLLCRWARQALKGVPWEGSYSIVQFIRHLMGHGPASDGSAVDAGG